MQPVLLALLAAAVVALLIWYGVVQERKRLAAFEAWALADGWAFRPGRVKNPGHEYPLFRVGHTRYLQYAADKTVPTPTPGLDDVRLSLFEYHYAVSRSAGKHRHTDHYHFTCALLDPGVDLGCVALRPEGLGDKLVQAMGFDDIDLEDGEFSRRYVVSARVRKDAYELLDGPMMRFLSAQRAPELETRGRELFLHVRTRATPESYRSLTALVLGLLAQLPRPLVNVERARRGLPPLLEAGNASSSSRLRLERLEGREA